MDAADAGRGSEERLAPILMTALAPRSCSFRSSLPAINPVTKSSIRSPS
jgi:hypothetical protein